MDGEFVRPMSCLGCKPSWKLKDFFWSVPTLRKAAFLATYAGDPESSRFVLFGFGSPASESFGLEIGGVVRNIRGCLLLSTPPNWWLSFWVLLRTTIKHRPHLTGVAVAYLC